MIIKMWQELKNLESTEILIEEVFTNVCYVRDFLMRPMCYFNIFYVVL